MSKSALTAYLQKQISQLGGGLCHITYVHVLSV